MSKAMGGFDSKPVMGFVLRISVWVSENLLRQCLRKSLIWDSKCACRTQTRQLWAELHPDANGWSSTWLGNTRDQATPGVSAVSCLLLSQDAALTP